MADIRAELEYMAKGVTADEFQAAALAEVGRMQAELERLRARDEKAKAVVQLLSGRRRPTYRDLQADWPELTTALDALARTHEDGGTDR